MYANAPMGVNNVTAIDLFNTVHIYGDLTKDAVIASSSSKNIRPVFQFVKDGALQAKAYAYWPGSGATPSFGAMTTVIPFSFPDNLTAPTNLEFFWNTGNYSQKQVYVTNSTTAITFNLPQTHVWPYNEGVKYQRPSLGYDVIKINGTYLAAIHNASYSASSEAGKFKYFSRMYVANLGATPGLNSAVDGFLFDSREGDKNGVEANGGPKGTGFSPTGMLSYSPFDTSKTMLGDNDYEAFYVLLAPSADGRSVQAYMMGTNQGILAYNIPFSKF